MRKPISIIIIVALFLIGLYLFSTNGCEEKKHPSGRDTIESFGDGRFQILGPSDTKSLYDGEAQDMTKASIEDNVYKYKVKGDLVYVIGQRGYTIVNYRTGEINQYKEINKFTLGDRKIFKDMR